MKRFINMLLIGFLFTIIIYLPFGVSYGNTSGSITSHPRIRIDYSISGGIITNVTERGNPSWSKHYTGTVSPGDTITVTITGSTNHESHPGSTTAHDSTFSFSASIDGEVTDDSISASFPPKGSSPTGTATIHITEGMKNISINSSTCVVWHAIGSGTWSQCSRFIARFNVVEPVEKEIIPVTSVRITNCPDKLSSGKSIQMMAIVLPSNAMNKTVNWSVEDQSIAEIQQNGILTAKSEGKTAITVTSTDNPNVKHQCLIEVTKPEEGDPTINIINCPGKLNPGDKGQLNAVVDPDRDKKGKIWRIGWFADNENLLYIDTDTGAYEAKIPGQVNISAFLFDKPLTQSHCTVTINDAQSEKRPEQEDQVLPEEQLTQQEQLAEDRDQSFYPTHYDSVVIDPKTGRPVEEIISERQAEIQRMREKLANAYNWPVDHISEEEAELWLDMQKAQQEAAKYRDDEFNELVVEIINDIRDLGGDPTKTAQDRINVIWALYTGNWRLRTGPELVAEFMKQFLPGKILDKTLKWTVGKDYPDKIWDSMNADPEPLYYQVPKVCADTGSVLLDPETGEMLMETISRDENRKRKRGLSHGLYHQ